MSWIQFSTRNWEWCMTRPPKLGQRLWKMAWCLVIVNEAHEPEVMPVNGDNLNVPLWLSLSHDHRVNRSYICQWYHNLNTKNTQFLQNIVNQSNNNYVDIFISNCWRTISYLILNTCEACLETSYRMDKLIEVKILTLQF